MAERRKSYAEQLKDPRWQKKRLEILDRDEWTCHWCKSTEKTLHVHHGYYERGMYLWDYPNWSLVTFCEECHQRASVKILDILKALPYLSEWEYDAIHGYAVSHVLTARPHFATRPRGDMNMGFCDFFRVSPDLLDECVEQHGEVDAKTLFIAARKWREQPLTTHAGADHPNSAPLDTDMCFA